MIDFNQSADDQSTVIPFGKYKGQPVDTLLADGDYLRWMLAQPNLVQMLRERYPALFNIVTTGAPRTDDTPEHNRIQARFLDRNFQEAIFEAVSGERLTDIAEKQAASDNIEALQLLTNAVSQARLELEKAQDAWGKWNKEPKSREDWIKYDTEVNGNAYLYNRHTGKELEDAISHRIEAHQRQGEAMGRRLMEFESALRDRSNYKHQPIPVIKPRITVEFEHGYDVQIKILLMKSFYDNDYNRAVRSYVLNWPPQKLQHPYLQRCGAFEELHIEIKPQIGDDFPSVLRQIRRNGANVVLAGQFYAAGATLDQVRQMFGERKIILVSEVDRIIARNI